MPQTSNSNLSSVSVIQGSTEGRNLQPKLFPLRPFAVAAEVIPWHENSPPPPPDDIPDIHDLGDHEILGGSILEEINSPEFLNEDPMFTSNNASNSATAAPASTNSLYQQDFSSISSLNLRSITPFKTEDNKTGECFSYFS